MINRNHTLSISKQAKLIGISRGSVYYQQRPMNAEDLRLMRKIDELHLEFPFMGSRMLRDQLRRQGEQIGRKRTRSLMKRMGIEALYRKPKTSQKHPHHEVFPYLLRGKKIETANKVWALDTTYIPRAKGYVYLTGVVDWASRKILAVKIAVTLESTHAFEILQEAFRLHGHLR